MESLSFLPGYPLPAGAAVYNDGVNFSLFSRHAFSVTLDIFENPDDSEPCYSYTYDPHLNRTGDMWHVFVKGLKQHALYLYRVDGPFAPLEGMRKRRVLPIQKHLAEIFRRNVRLRILTETWRF